MTVVRSVAVKNMYSTSTIPFWPGGGRELNVEFGADSDGMCNVWGIDPDNNNEVVFNGVLRTAQQDSFVEAVRNGQPGTLVSNENVQYLVPLEPAVSGATAPLPGKELRPPPGRVTTALADLTDPIDPPDGFAVVIPGGGPPPP